MDSDKLNDKLKDKLKLDRRGILPGFAAGHYEPARQYDLAEFANAQHEDPVRRDNRINIRVSGMDMTELHRQALTEGLPLQSLLAQIIHQYATGQLLKAEPEAARQGTQQPGNEKTLRNADINSLTQDPS